MMHYFEKAEVTTLTNFGRITLDDLNKIISDHDKILEVCDLREFFQKWKAEQLVSTAPSIASSVEVFSDHDSSSAKNIEVPAKIRFTRNIQDSRGDFREYMTKSLMSRLILAKFEDVRCLTSTQKSLVIREAVEFMVLGVPGFPRDFPRSSEYEYTEQQIQNVFGGVFSKEELLGYKKFDENGSKISEYKGKLKTRVYDVSKILNRKSKDKTKNKDKGNEKGTDQEEIEDVDEHALNDGLSEVCNEEDNEQLLQKELTPENIEVIEALDFVRKHKGPESKVFEQWKKCSSLRKDQTFNEFPALKSTFGKKLIMWDFNDVYPGKVEEFMEQLEKSKKKLLIQFDSEISDPLGRELLTFLEKEKNIKAENFLYLALIPFLFSPISTKRNKMVRRSVSTSANFFWCQVKVSYFL